LARDHSARAHRKEAIAVFFLPVLLVLAVLLLAPVAVVLAAARPAPARTRRRPREVR
jgi:hypothetical protein